MEKSAKKMPRETVDAVTRSERKVLGATHKPHINILQRLHGVCKWQEVKIFGEF